jgi:hypothetical protein
MHRLKLFLQSKPVYLYLLCVFFVLHNFTENYAVFAVKEALELGINLFNSRCTFNFYILALVPKFSQGKPCSIWPDGL